MKVIKYKDDLGCPFYATLFFVLIKKRFEFNI